MIRIDRKKLVNKFKISFCVERLVSQIYRVKVGNIILPVFEKKSRRRFRSKRPGSVERIFENNKTFVLSDTNVVGFSFEK